MPEFARLERREAPQAALEDLLRVHPRRLRRALLARGAANRPCRRSMPTRCCRRLRARRRCAPPARSPPRSMRSSPARPTTRSAPCARPATMPSRDRAMGFCLFNNVAIGALRAREVHGLARVAVDRFRRPSRQRHAGRASEDDASLFYASTHQSPLYPGTGAASETGVGNIVNVPLRPMSGSRAVPPRRDARHPAGARRVPARDWC